MMQKSDFNSAQRSPTSIREHVPLAPYTTFAIGGPARYFATVTSLEELHEALAFAREKQLKLFILGGGSNILMSDTGFDGLVIKLEILGITAREEARDEGSTTFVTVNAGVMWDDFVVWTIQGGLKGLECMSGVPGTVGGAVVANVGAYGAQVSDTFVHAEVLDVADPSPTLKVIPNAECAFSYHDSMFSQVEGRYVIVSATFALSRGVVGTVPAYRDNRFDMSQLASELGHPPSQTEVRSAVLDMRENKGSLIMPGRVSLKCAGSFFHMPFVSEAEYEEVVRRAQELDAAKEERLRPWAWRQADGRYKVAPGFLLEYTEFKKGFVKGEAGVSPRHTLTVINVGGATASDIASLARDMQAAVKKVFNIEIEREVEYVGTF